MFRTYLRQNTNPFESAILQQMTWKLQIIYKLLNNELNKYLLTLSNHISIRYILTYKNVDGKLITANNLIKIQYFIFNFSNNI